MEPIKSDIQNFNINTMARIHSFESFGTVDGPRNSLCTFYARMPFAL